MSLRPEELMLCKQQLGYPLTRLGAEPWVAYVVIFDRVIQPYLFDNSTTSSTAVTAGSTTAITIGANAPDPNNAALLTFNVGTSIVVDVGTSLEVTTITALVGLSLTAAFANAHSGTYTIWPNGAEWAVRGILTRIATIETNLNALAPPTAGAQQVDEIKMYASHKATGRGATRDAFESLVQQRRQARNDLAAALGVPNLFEIRAGNGAVPSRVEAY